MCPQVGRGGRGPKPGSSRSVAAPCARPDGSPSARRFPDDASVHLVLWHEGESVVKTLSATDANDLRTILEELGVSLRDVFGADYIIWVEGSTEVICFPLILCHKGIEVSRGLKFIPLTSASELSQATAKAKALVDILKRLSTSNAIIPPTVAISLDRERHNDTQLEQLKEKLGENVHFLNRRCIENYFINIDAISAVIIGSGFDESSTEVRKNVQEWLVKNAGSEEYRASHYYRNGSITNVEWLKKVDGAKMLKDIFNDVTKCCYRFSKTTHTPMLLKWLLDNSPSEIEELTTYVTDLYPFGMKPE
jgi:hypothetical protein